jgi:transitional endoplasmic reticulum ATPase
MDLVDQALKALKNAQHEEDINNIENAILSYRNAASLLMKSSKLEMPDIAGRRRKQAESITLIADNLQEKLNKIKDNKKEQNKILLSDDIIEGKSVLNENRESYVIKDDAQGIDHEININQISDNEKNTSEDKEFLEEMGIDNINIPDITFQDIVGLDTVKDEVKIKILLPLIRKEYAKVYDITAGGGILIYGPPGNGKTMLAKAIAHEAHAYFININPSNLLNQWFGRFEKNIEKLFKITSRYSPSVLFFDEIDAIAPKRAKTNSSYMKRAVTALLSEMDGVSTKNNALLVIGATNNPWDMDEAFLRPGRLDERLYVSPPDMTSREKLFEMYLKNAMHDAIDYSLLAGMTENFSSADIKYVCTKAKENVFHEVTETNAIRNINNNDLINAVNSTKPSVSTELLSRYLQFRDS